IPVCEIVCVPCALSLDDCGRGVLTHDDGRAVRVASAIESLGRLSNDSVVRIDEQPAPVAVFALIKVEGRRWADFASPSRLWHLLPLLSLPWLRRILSR